MQRADVVTVATNEPYGRKPRPAVIIQTDLFPPGHKSIVICQISSLLTDDPRFRVMIEPDAYNGLQKTSQVMVDKIMTVPRERVGKHIGRLDAVTMAALDNALLFVLGLGITQPVSP